MHFSFSNFLVLFVALLIINKGWSQKNCLKDLSKNNPQKAFDCASSKIQKKPNDVYLNYIFSEIYSKDILNKYDIYRAYENIILCKKNFKLLALDEQQNIIKSFIKYNYSDNFIEEKLFEICNKALDEAKAKNTIEDYNYLIQKIEVEVFVNKAKALRNNLAFQIAKKNGSVESFEKFITTYPNAEEINEAIKLRNVKAFQIAKENGSVESFEKFITTYPNAEEINEAIKLRNAKAFQIAKEINTVSSFQLFIDKYPNASQFKEAISFRNTLAFTEAKEIASETSMNNFIEKYPNSSQIKQAILLRDNFSFNTCLSLGSSLCLEDFIEKYPTSSLVKTVETKIDSLIFLEKTIKNTFQSYLDFHNDFPENEFHKYAMDSLYSIAINSEKIWYANYLISSFNNDSRNIKLYEKLKAFFFSDGEHTTLKYYLNNYPNIPSKHRTEAEELYKNSLKANSLYMEIGATKESIKLYEDFINSMAPYEIAFVALQRLISNLLNLKMYSQAQNILLKFKKKFPNDNRISDLYSLLKKPKIEIYNKSFKYLNTNLDEYSPVPTLDNKNLFFCGLNRSDGVGGEDIFIYNKRNKNVSLINSLSSADGNEAPLSISADGNTMLIWNNENNGDLFYSEKLINGWSEPIAFPSPVNSPYYEGDAQFTSDGKSILFVSSRPGGYGIYTDNDIQYHGDNEYPTDIYICHLNELGEWSDPINLGPEINTQYSERSPFLHPDGKTLYFSSDGHYSLGRLDVFMSTKKDSSWTKWKKPTNLGKEINTSGKDWGFKFSTDGNKGYYSKSGKRSLTSIIFLLDISGSMSGAKINDTKKAAKEAALNALKNNSEVAILMFDGSCEKPITNMIGFSTNIISIVAAIDAAYARGSTPMYMAMKEANEYMRKYKSPQSRDQLIVLMSDGDANACENLDNLIYNLKTARTFYKHYTIGLEVYPNSRAYNDLTKIANASKGKFIHAKSSNQLGRLFADATNSLYNIGNLGAANKDVFSFKVPKHLKPDPVATIAGTIKDSKGKPVQVTLKWEDLESGKNMGICKSDPRNGEYFIALPEGHIYGYYVSEKGYFPSDNNIDLRSKSYTNKVDEEIIVYTLEELKEGDVDARVNNIFFDYNKYKLKRESFTQLNKIITILNKDLSLNAKISGHTDSDGEDDYNQKLSEKRAEAVMNYLTKKGINKTRLKAIGYGESKPVQDNSTEKGKKLNRRVEFKFSAQ